VNNNGNPEISCDKSEPVRGYVAEKLGAAPTKAQIFNVKPLNKNNYGRIDGRF
jgi:hypothetical protein